MTQERSTQFSDVLLHSHTGRMVLIALLALLIQLPVALIGALVSERQTRREEAVTEVSSKWGNAQDVIGPALVVPYTVKWVETVKNRRTVKSESRNAVFLPEQLTIRGRATCQERMRGIFPVAVYRMDVVVEGEFARPDFADLGVNPAEVSWNKAQLAIAISDVRAIQEQAAVAWAGTHAAFLPGAGAFGDASAGIHAITPIPAGASRIAFSFPLILNGSTSARFAPFGRTTTVDIQSNYTDPSFQGAWLPADRQVSARGFHAKWSIPFLGRNYPQSWKADAGMKEAIEGSRFGFDLIQPLDQYRMADRSVKYAPLIIGLTFLTIWLIEVLAGLRVHPIQYVMLGAALCMFFLLELALAEHLGFLGAYTLAAISVIAMLGAYCITVLRRASRAAAVASGVVMLYLYLYVVLTNEDYALLIGSLGLFAILALVMFLTRRIDWSAAGKTARRPRRSRAA